MAEVRVCASEAEERRSVEIYNAVCPEDAVTLEESRAFAASARRFVDFLAHDDGRAVGSGFSAVFSPRPTTAFTLVTVLPEARGRGVGTALYRAISEWGRPDLTALDARVAGGDEHSLAYALRRGFVEVERRTRLVLELRGRTPPEVAAPEGVEILSLAADPALLPGIYEVACEAVPDVPGRGQEAMEPLEDWLGVEFGGPGDRPEATFVARAAGLVVGYAKASLSGARPGTVQHDMTAVRRAWRGRGIAGALKRAQIRWAMENGFERLVTENELRNEPMRRVNLRLGYVEGPGQVILRGPLAAP